MTRPELLLMIVAMALISLAERSSFLVLKDRLVLPVAIRRALTYVPPAVLSAIVAPALFRGGDLALGPIDVRLMAGVVAGLVAWRTKSVLATFGIGMVTLWLLSWMLA